MDGCAWNNPPQDQRFGRNMYIRCQGLRDSGLPDSSSFALLVGWNTMWTLVTPNEKTLWSMIRRYQRLAYLVLFDALSLSVCRSWTRDVSPIMMGWSFVALAHVQASLFATASLPAEGCRSCCEKGPSRGCAPLPMCAQVRNR